MSNRSSYQHERQDSNFRQNFKKWSNPSNKVFRGSFAGNHPKRFVNLASRRKKPFPRWIIVLGVIALGAIAVFILFR